MFSLKRILAAGVLAAAAGAGLAPATASADSFDRYDGRRGGYGGYGGGVHVVQRYYDDCYDRTYRSCDPPVRYETYSYRDCDGPVYYRTYRRDYPREHEVRYFRGRVGEVYRYYDR